MQAGGSGLVEGQGQDGSCSWAPSQSCPEGFLQWRALLFCHQLAGAVPFIVFSLFHKQVQD
jgi:hypothetical protein